MLVKIKSISCSNNAVGIFHETYIMESKSYEAIYVNMPVCGLAQATGHNPITSKKNSATNRLDL
ncbi:monooxygenase family protein [Oceanobacillus halotolerans]|uniref:monooxygenase family protein n=1 Tax=Oceanobacillus halotolerans TaxID=2663380 RepID=UPI0013DC278B|nr:DUF4188 domain-containing protein [Oceanobacillus halotolerans]